MEADYEKAAEGYTYKVVGPTRTAYVKSAEEANDMAKKLRDGDEAATFYPIYPRPEPG